jgi:hypothetical protein
MWSSHLNTAVVLMTVFVAASNLATLDDNRHQIIASQTNLLDKGIACRWAVRA